ncbi:MAG TPA: hypothetical protein PLP33_24795 [Leptospiraceae bacterium]|nr:hypothetical protein [Leptospiraceae bacterium]
MTSDRKKKLESEGWQFGDAADFLCIPEEERAEFWEVAEKCGEMLGKSPQELIQQDVENIVEFEKSVADWEK